MALKNKKSLGQHWLRDREVLTNIAKCASMEGVGTVVEIGPGLGTLTSALFLYFDEVVAVEFDGELARKLPGSFPGKKLTVLERDVLGLDLVADLPEEYVLAGNIPYYITSAIVRKFLTGERRPRRMVLLVQKEVAERLAAGVGDYSVLGLSAQIYAKVSLGPVVGRNQFTPAPKVDSQVVILEPYAVARADEGTMGLIKTGFRAPRKKLVSNLGGFGKERVREILGRMGVSENARPADLTVEQWKELERYVKGR